MFEAVGLWYTNLYVHLWQKVLYVNEFSGREISYLTCAHPLAHTYLCNPAVLDRSLTASGQRLLSGRDASSAGGKVQVYLDGIESAGHLHRSIKQETLSVNGNAIRTRTFDLVVLLHAHSIFNLAQLRQTAFGTVPKCIALNQDDGLTRTLSHVIETLPPTCSIAMLSNQHTCVPSCSQSRLAYNGQLLLVPSLPLSTSGCSHPSIARPFMCPDGTGTSILPWLFWAHTSTNITLFVAAPFRPT